MVKKILGVYLTGISKLIQIGIIVIMCSVTAFGQVKMPSSMVYNNISLNKDTAKSSVLNETISINMEEIPLLEAVKNIAAKAQLEIVYNSKLLKGIDRQVTIQSEYITVMEALWEALEDTKLRFAVSANKQLVLMERDKIDNFSGYVSSALQEQETIIGTVRDDQSGQTLPGVNILVKGTTTGTSTDINGAFEVDVPSLQDTLVVTFIGYQPQEIPINGQVEIDVQLAAEVIVGEEVMVIGYGTQRKENLTGSVGSINSENIEGISLSRMDDALVGQFAGVSIQQTIPEAGGAPEIRVRGQGSLSFDSDPLVVVDGISVGNSTEYLSSMNMDNVASVEVLKDASSSAIYGSRGANGVILITTKEGLSGPTKLSYSGYLGYKSVPKSDLLSSPDEWADHVRANNNGQLTERMQYIQDMGHYTDWEEEIYPGGTIMNHSLTASGGSDNTTFLVSLNYLEDEGVLLSNDFSKLNFRINIDTQVRDNLSFGLRLNPSRTQTTEFPINVHDALRDGAWVPTYLTEETLPYVNPYRSNGRWADAQVGDYAMEGMFDGYDLASGMPVPSGGLFISETSGQSTLGGIHESEDISD